MRITHVLLIAAFACGCAKRGPELRQPVGQTMVTSSRPLDAANGRKDGATPADAGVAYLTGEGDGPCGMEQLPVIPFAFGSSDIDERHAMTVDKLVSCLNEAPWEKTSIVLVGYADLVGTIHANLMLGLERAKAVMGKLIVGGVSPGRIVVASAGELQRPNARLGPRDSRVEVLVARGGPPRPNEAPITRGIDAQGLIPRPRRESVGQAPPGPRPAPSRPVFRQPAPPPRFVPPAGR